MLFASQSLQLEVVASEVPAGLRSLVITQWQLTLDVFLQERKNMSAKVIVRKEAAFFMFVIIYVLKKVINKKQIYGGTEITFNKSTQNISLMQSKPWNIST